MIRTADQVAVDEQLKQAVTAWLETYGAGAGRMLTDFIVIGATQGYSDEGVPTCATFVAHAEDAIPHYRMLGLLSSARLYLTGGIGTEVYDEDDEEE